MPAELLERAVRDGVTPSYDLAVLVGGEPTLALRGGWIEPGVPVPGDAVWDLASLTKPLVGAPLAWRLVDEGLLGFDEELRRILPDLSEGVTLAHLLSHSAGYPAWRPLYEQVDEPGSSTARELILELARTCPLESEPGIRHAYSDLGFLALCALLEHLGGARVDVLARDLPLDGLTWGSPRAVPTEDCPVRGRVVRGEVHDLNCWAMGGVSTHAGLFGDARSVAMAAQAHLQRFRSGRSRALREAWTRRGAGSHLLGWDGRSGENSSSGALFPPESVGHLGFTGTSVWLAPREEVVVVLLTNRVHPSVEDVRIRQLRPALHDAVVGWLRRRGRWVR
mgnify:CR=1 FL=1